MVNLRNANFAQIEEGLKLQFSDQFKTLWLQYSNTKSRVRICITLFPKDQNHYRMIFADYVKDFSFTSILNLIK